MPDGVCVAEAAGSTNPHSFKSPQHYQTKTRICAQITMLKAELSKIKAQQAASQAAADIRLTT